MEGIKEKECTDCGSRQLRGCSSAHYGLMDRCNKMTVFDWLNFASIGSDDTFLWAEVRFKNTRKDFFLNVHRISLQVGDLVVVEGNPGKDLGMVTILGALAEIQMRKKGIEIKEEGAKKILRKARQHDIELWNLARSRENSVMLEARKIAREMNLNMKISDVEFQGDNTKAIFYYIADQRVDFRELIKVYAQRFGIKVEMKQIGKRQEAALVGGIGSCGRELCCSTWLTDFRSVTTTVARYQQLSLNPQKLAGQCGKLKCCLNYELDHYVEALASFPNLEKTPLKFSSAELIWFKNDIFKMLMWFFNRQNPSIQYALPLEEVNKILHLNRQGIFPDEIPTKMSSSGDLNATNDPNETDMAQVLDEEDKNSLNQRLKTLKKNYKASDRSKNKPFQRKRK